MNIYFTGTKAEMEELRDHLEKLEPSETEADHVYRGGGRHAAKSAGLRTNVVEIRKHPTKNEYTIACGDLIKKHNGEIDLDTGNIIDTSKAKMLPSDWEPTMEVEAIP